MTLLDHIGLRRRTLALIGAAAIALAVVAGPSPAMAVRSLPGTPETSDGAGFLGDELGSQPGSAASRQAKRVDLSGDGCGGFIYRHGRYIPLDTVGDRITVHLAINNRGQTAGSYVRSLDPIDFGGFVRSRTGRYTAIDAELGSSTLILDVNDEGTTVGAYGDCSPTASTSTSSMPPSHPPSKRGGTSTPWTTCADNSSPALANSSSCRSGATPERAGSCWHWAPTAPSPATVSSSTPHYQTMGLYGSEYWTYLLPRRVGEAAAAELTQQRLPIGAGQAARLGVVDEVLPGRPAEFEDAVLDYAQHLAGRYDHAQLVEHKRAARAADELAKPLEAYRIEELAEMSRDIFHDRHSFSDSRHAFVTKAKPSSTPGRLSSHQDDRTALSPPTT